MVSLSPDSGHACAALIVDDEAGIRSVVRRWFERQGWHVDEAGDGAAALPFLESAYAQAPTYDLIIADWNMPELGGAGLHRWISEHRPELLGHLVLSTGDVTDAQVATLVESSPCRVLAKPYSLAELGALVTSIRLPGHEET